MGWQSLAMGTWREARGWQSLAMGTLERGEGVAVTSNGHSGERRGGGSH